MSADIDVIDAEAAAIAQTQADIDELKLQIESDEAKLNGEGVDEVGVAQLMAQAAENEELDAAQKRAEAEAQRAAQAKQEADKQAAKIKEEQDAAARRAADAAKKRQAEEAKSATKRAKQVSHTHTPRTGATCSPRRSWIVCLS